MYIIYIIRTYVYTLVNSMATWHGNNNRDSFFTWTSESDLFIILRNVACIAMVTL